MSKIRTAFNRFRGHPVEDDLSAYSKTVRRIRQFHKSAALGLKTDAELGIAAAALCSRLVKTAALPQPDAMPGLVPPADARIEAFALALEAARRATGLAAHDVQIIAGLAMADGKIAELPTGEGKTLAAVFPASLFALSGRGVHVLTFNDYLARRDAAWMGPVYRLLGLSVGAVQEGMDKPAKQAGLRLRRHLRHRQGGRLRLPARPPGLRARRARPPAASPSPSSTRPTPSSSTKPASRWSSRATAGAGATDASPAGRRSCAASSRAGTSRPTPSNANVFLTDAGIRRIESAPRLRQPLRARRTRRSWPRSTAPSTPRPCSSATSTTSSATAASRSSTSSPAGSWTSATGPTACRPPSKPRRACAAAPRAASSARSPCSISSASTRRSAA